MTDSEILMTKVEVINCHSQVIPGFNSDSLPLYTLTSACIFSTLFLHIS